MTQPGTDQHEGRIAVREGPHHPSSAADLPVKQLNYIIGTDPGPVLIGEITVGQGFLNWAATALAFSRAAFLLSWAWIALSILATNFTLERGTTENTLR